MFLKVFLKQQNLINNYMNLEIIDKIIDALVS